MRLCLLLLSTFLLSSAIGQRTITTISAQLSFPQQEYKQTYPVSGVGIRWNVMHRPSAHIPISIGGELGLLVTGSDSKFFDLYYLGFYDRYRITASNNIVTIAFKARADLLADDKPVQLFVDGTFGTTIFFSSVDAERQTFFGNSQYAGGNSTRGYWAMMGGPGLGIEIPLGKEKEVSLSLKTSYLFGSHTKYLTNPYVDNNGGVYFTERESATDMIITEAGIRLGLFRKRNR